MKKPCARKNYSRTSEECQKQVFFHGATKYFAPGSTKRIAINVEILRFDILFRRRPATKTVIPSIVDSEKTFLGEIAKVEPREMEEEEESQSPLRGGERRGRPPQIWRRRRPIGGRAPSQITPRGSLQICGGRPLLPSPIWGVLKKALAKAEEKAAKEQAAREKHEARLDAV